MTRKAANDALLNALLQDDGLLAWTGNFGRPFTPKVANRPLKLLDPKDDPHLILELGDGSNALEVGGYAQMPQVEVLVGVLWTEDDYERAFGQATELTDLMIRAVMLDPSLGGAVEAAWVSKFESDRNANHPRHSANFTVTIEYRVTR